MFPRRNSYQTNTAACEQELFLAPCHYLVDFFRIFAIIEHCALGLAFFNARRDKSGTPIAPGWKIDEH
jgi:hypothetical protein